MTIATTPPEAKPEIHDKVFDMMEAGQIIFGPRGFAEAYPPRRLGAAVSLISADRTVQMLKNGHRPRQNHMPCALVSIENGFNNTLVLRR